MQKANTINATSISPCNYCYCMTKTISGKCGKCSAQKANTKQLCNHGIPKLLCSHIHEPTSAETPPTSEPSSKHLPQEWRPNQSAPAPQRELPGWEERLKRIKSIVQKKLDDTTQTIYTEFPPRFVAGGGDPNKRMPQREEKLKLEMAIYKDVLDLLEENTL